MLLNCRTNVSARSYCQLLFFLFFNCFVAAVPWTVNKVVYKDRKNWVVTLAIWGDVTPGAILPICGMWADMVDVITCVIFGNGRLRGVGVVRGVCLPSPIDLTRRPYNTGHTTVWPCDSTSCQPHQRQLLSSLRHSAYQCVMLRCFCLEISFHQVIH